MSDDPQFPADTGAGPGEPGDGDLGEPVAELRELAWQPAEDFQRRVNGRIERRLLTGRLLDVAWSAPLMVLLELLRAPFELFSGSRPTE